MAKSQIKQSQKKNNLKDIKKSKKINNKKSEIYQNSSDECSFIHNFSEFQINTGNINNISAKTNQKGANICDGSYSKKKQFVPGKTHYFEDLE